MDFTIFNLNLYGFHYIQFENSDNSNFIFGIPNIPILNIRIFQHTSRSEVWVQCHANSEFCRPFLRFLRREFALPIPSTLTQTTPSALMHAALIMGLQQSDIYTELDVFDYLTERAIGQQVLNVG